ncbi:MAG: Clp protease N-terminal domain-containing protein [Terracidiphilus sp.]
MTSEDLYRILLKAYPAQYRRQFEEAMAQCFRDQLRAADTRGKRVRLWFRTVADFALNVPARYFDSAHGTPYLGAYSERARRAIYFARLEKGPLSYGEISLENLLLGVLRSDEELTGALFGFDGINTLVAMVRAMETKKAVLPSTIFRWERRRSRRGGTLDRDCKNALAMARKEAHNSGASVSSRHILLGILKQDTSLAASLLREHAIDLSYLRSSSDRDTSGPHA